MAMLPKLKKSKVLYFIIPIIIIIASGTVFFIIKASSPPSSDQANIYLGEPISAQTVATCGSTIRTINSSMVNNTEWLSVTSGTNMWVLRRPSGGTWQIYKSADVINGNFMNGVFIQPG